MKKRIIVLVTFFSFLSCTDKNDNDEIQLTSQTNINLVTGLDIRQDGFSEAIRLGNPNNLVDNAIVYPNPSIDFLSIQTLNASNISSVWIVDGNEEKIYQDLNFSTVLNSNLYSEEQLAETSTLEFSDNSSSNLLLNLESLPKGYYKVFIEINGNIEWHNIYKGGIDIQDLIDYWNN